MLYLGIDQSFIISFDIPLVNKRIPIIGKLDCICNNLHDLILPSIDSVLPIHNSIHYYSAFPNTPSNISPIYSIATYNENVLADSFETILFVKRSHTISIPITREYFVHEPIRLALSKKDNLCQGTICNSTLSFTGILLHLLRTKHTFKLDVINSNLCNTDNTCEILYALNTYLFAKTRALIIYCLSKNVSIPLCNILRPLKLYGNNIPLDIEFSIYRGFPSERIISPPVIKSIQRKRLNSYFW